MKNTIDIITEYNSEYLLVNFAANAVMVIVVILIIFLVSRKSGKRDATILFVLYCYHTMMSICYYILTKNIKGVDTKYYFSSVILSDRMSDLYGYGGKFVIFTLFPFVKYIKLNFFSCFMLHSVFGFLGLIVLSQIIKEVRGWNSLRKWYIWGVLFLPGLNFWTSMVGKDSLVFLGISLFFYALLDLRKRKLVALSSIIFIMHVRPYVTMMIIPCLIVSILFTSRTMKLHQKIIFCGLLAAVMVPVYNAFLEHTRLTALNFEVVEKVFDSHQANWGGGSFVDLRNSNIVIKLFTYIYRPLFLDTHSIAMIIASMENVLLIVISAYTFSYKCIKLLIKKRDLFLRFNWCYFILSSVILASSTPNLGTAVRQKNMALIALLIIYSNYRMYRIDISQRKATVNR